MYSDGLYLHISKYIYIYYVAADIFLFSRLYTGTFADGIAVRHDSVLWNMAYLMVLDCSFPHTRCGWKNSSFLLYII
jgi:hypothetical protein